MRAAIAEARRAAAEDEVPVGAVLVKDGAIVDVEISYPQDLTTQMLGYSGARSV